MVRLNKNKFWGFFYLDWKSKREQSINRIDLKRAEINFKNAKDALMAKVNYYRENKYYVNLNSMCEYAYYLGCKEILKRENEKRKYIKYFIKNMNKEQK